MGRAQAWWLLTPWARRRWLAFLLLPRRARWVAYPELVQRMRKMGFPCQDISVVGQHLGLERGSSLVRAF